MPRFLLEGGLPVVHTLNSSVPVPHGISVSIQPTETQRSFGTDYPTAAAIIEFGANVSASMVAAWLYEHLQKHKARKIRINRKEITVSEGEIKKIIEESISVDK